MNFFDAKRPRSGIRNEFRPQRARPHHPFSRFFQNSLLTLFLLFAATAPASAQVPSKVTLSRAHTPTADGFTVAWSDLSNETAYHLEHTTSANFTTSTLITNISANATSHALTGLTPGTTYYVRMRGAAAGGNGTWSDVQANQLLSIDPGQTRYLSVAGIPHGASHSVNFTVSDIFGSANSAGLASGATSSEASTIMLLGSDGSTAHTVFYNSSQNQWREGDTNKGSEVVGFGKGFIVRNNTGSADVFLLSGEAAPLDAVAVSVFDAGAPAGRLRLLSTSKSSPTGLDLLGFVLTNNTTTGLKRAVTAKDADLLLVPDGSGGLKRYHYDGTNWKSGLRIVSDPAAITIPAGGAFFLRKASGSSFEQWTPPLDEDPDATAYLNAVEAADGQALEIAVRRAVNDFIKGCKADGIWSAIKASCILAGARTLNGALVPLVGTAPTNVGGNFASGDYNRETGLKGNAGNKLLNSNRDNSADPQNNQHLAVFATEAGTTNARFAGFGNGTTGRTTLGHNTSTQLTTRNRSNAFVTHSTAYSVPCLLGVSRSLASEYTFIRNGTTGAVASTSETPAAGSIEIFRGSVDPSNSRLAFYSIGESLNLTLLHNRVSTLMTDLAAAIP